MHAISTPNFIEICSVADARKGNIQSYIHNIIKDLEYNREHYTNMFTNIMTDKITRKKNCHQMVMEIHDH